MTRKYLIGTPADRLLASLPEHMKASASVFYSNDGYEVIVRQSFSQPKPGWIMSKWLYQVNGPNENGQFDGGGAMTEIGAIHGAWGLVRKFRKTRAKCEAKAASLSA